MVDGAGVDSPALTKIVSQVETSLVTVGDALKVISEQTHTRFVEVEHEGNGS